VHSSYLQSTAFPPPPPAILGRLTLPRWYFRSSHSDGLGFRCNSSLQIAGESSAAAPNFWQGWWVQDGRLKGTDLTQLCIALDKAELCPKAELYFQLLSSRRRRPCLFHRTVFRSLQSQPDHRQPKNPRSPCDLQPRPYSRFPPSRVRTITLRCMISLHAYSLHPKRPLHCLRSRKISYQRCKPCVDITKTSERPRHPSYQNSGNMRARNRAAYASGTLHPNQWNSSPRPKEIGKKEYRTACQVSAIELLPVHRT